MHLDLSLGARLQWGTMNCFYAQLLNQSSQLLVVKLLAIVTLQDLRCTHLFEELLQATSNFASLLVFQFPHPCPLCEAVHTCQQITLAMVSLQLRPAFADVGEVNLSTLPPLLDTNWTQRLLG